MAVLVLGTRNLKKRRELEALLGGLPIELRTLQDYPHALEIDETGATFAENARLKAARQACHLHAWVLGEDSGLSVDALHGRPGIHSARFSSPRATDAQNNDKLLAELQGVPAPQRTAHYICALALSDPQGQIVAESEGRCQGLIADRPHGEFGFGYDPLFLIAEYHATFGQLGMAVKSVISHRARALRVLQWAAILGSSPTTRSSEDC
jgi:XTP/dITP diphosphohydrolase